MPEHRHRLLRAVQTNSRLHTQMSGRGIVATPVFGPRIFPLPGPLQLESSTGTDDLLTIISDVGK
jgi:hypothetical protein